MNRTHGSVATMWILGSGLLLGASQSMDAQESAPPAGEFYAPQVIPQAVVPAQQSPGLLSENLGKANQSAVRPLAPSSNSSLSAGRKIAGDKVFPNARSVQATAHQEPATISVSQNVGAPSTVQQQLEELYRRDGKQMPPMTLQQAPNTQAVTPAANAGPAQGQIQRPMNNASQPAQNGMPYAGPPRTNNNSNSKPSFLTKINPFKNKPAPAPLPPYPAQPMPKGTINRPSNGQPFVPNQSQVAQPQLSNQSQFNNANAAGRPQQAAVNPAAVAPVATPTPQVSVANPTVTPTAAPAVTPTAQSQLAPTLPPVPGDADYVAPAANSDSADPVKTESINSVDEALENAFSDMLEEAPIRQPERQPETTAPADESPFQGISLDEAPAVSAKPISVEAQKPEEKPSEKLTEEPKSEPGFNIIPLPVEPDPAPAKTSASNDANAKVKLIKERGELRGLKGFCAVALRDTRDLKNALPEHTSTYKGRTYYFSSADAKGAFDQNPGQYAPISGGNDVVLLRHKITKEGSLDYAIWFKDRLYLFTSQKTLDQFVATPKEFAISGE